MANRTLLLKDWRNRSVGQEKCEAVFRGPRDHKKSRRTPLRAITGGKKLSNARTYHIQRESMEEPWTVFSDDGLVLGHCHDLGPAADLAIRAAERDHGQGVDVIVSIEREDGTAALAWAPQSQAR
jgi:hypothetical protein